MKKTKTKQTCLKKKSGLIYRQRDKITIVSETKADKNIQMPLGSFGSGLQELQQKSCCCLGQFVISASKTLYDYVILSKLISYHDTMSKCVGKNAVLVPEVKACIQLIAQRMQGYLNNDLICQINPLK